ncbi:NACHT_domain-containing protein [Hexamita inflata]|uniref:NACHT_domain-containing protein n=1 Tax=Hexamita inflata TaxID=28002 RepID=A0ABP1I0Q4_9EUKA
MLKYNDTQLIFQCDIYVFGDGQKMIYSSPLYQKITKFSCFRVLIVVQYSVVALFFIYIAAISELTIFSKQMNVFQLQLSNSRKRDHHSQTQQTNLSEIKTLETPGANLSLAMLEGSDFTGADLSNVDFQSVWLVNVKFNGSNMSNIEFGQRANISTQSAVLCTTFDKSEKHIICSLRNGKLKCLKLILQRYQENFSIMIM